MSNLGYSLVLNLGKVSSIEQFQILITRAEARVGARRSCERMYVFVLRSHMIYTLIMYMHSQRVLCMNVIFLHQ